MIDKNKLLEDIVKIHMDMVKLHKNEKDTVRDYFERVCECIQNQPEADGWIPIKWHETTEEDGFDMEKYPFCLDCIMPEDGDDIIVCRKNGFVTFDTYFYDDGFSLDSGCDWIEDIVAWQPLPEPFKHEEPENEPDWKESMMQHFLRGH
ncbi:hypothetical protein [Frisingicoccus sp.]|uniref:hypothetical protein n=1 Tax=Frisingicoccus sp. TaxID=1918627 RepID=UPI00386EB611